MRTCSCIGIIIMSEIADLVFAENSTLLEVLDQLQVPELSGEVTQIDSRLTQLTVQVSQLGQIVDQNQLNNQASFNSINTTLGAQTDDINNLTEDVTNLNESMTNLSATVSNLGQQFGDLSNEVAQFDSRISSNRTAINSIDARLTFLDTRVSQLGNDVDAAKLLVNQLSTEVMGLMTTVNSFQTQIQRLEGDMAAVKGLPGIVTPLIVYRLNNASTSNPWVRNIFINGTYGQRCRFGQDYNGFMDGVPMIMKFLDQFGQMTTASSPRDMAVNVGLQRFAYRASTTAGWVLTTVNVSKSNLS